MSVYRNSLPQAGHDLFLTDGGIETTLIFQEGLELPDFAAFHLLSSDEGFAALQKYYATYVALARDFGLGFILESPTWRANPDWGTKLGYSAAQLADANLRAVDLIERFLRESGDGSAPLVMSGCLCRRGDGYIADKPISPESAREYHSQQIGTFASSSADMVCAITMNYVEEAIGIALAAKEAQMPVAISFTVETDGRLPTGQSMKSAICQVDEATSAYPAYFMINCAHPTHFEGIAVEGGDWVGRIQGLRANASRMSHAELNDAPKLDSGNPEELGGQYAQFKSIFPNLNVMGGCCGTDHRHVTHIARACKPLFAGAAEQIVATDD